ncbi:MAG TPA: methyltransferase domain-containing protein [Terracidiphilus sp.]|nr:methyltransferase domain-containing protein [Terracidiphilus sp.]
MDGDCSYEDFRGCLRSLEQINRWLLGYRPTFAWLKHFLSCCKPKLGYQVDATPGPPTTGLRRWGGTNRERRPCTKQNGHGNSENAVRCMPPGSRERLHIVDVGCGGGDLLRRIAGWARRRGIAVELTGIDMNPYAARAAAEFTPRDVGIAWITGNALEYRPEKPMDVVVSSLMAHHLEDEEIVALLRWMEASAQAGWFINDLERSERSSRIFGWVERLAGWHRFVRHDAAVSFRRAFLKEDWMRLLAAAGIPREAVTVERWRPGRLCVGRWKG